MNLSKIKNFFFLTILSVILFNCSNDSSSNNTQEAATSKLSIRLVDDPGDFEHVYVEVVDVLIKVNNDSEDDNWESIEAINTGVYDLLELTGGVNVLLADNYEIPSGVLNQIRLVLGDDNSVVIDGVTHPLSTPSAQQSGLKIRVDETLEPDFEYTFWIDFDVEESIVIAGNSGNIILNPVLRAVTEVSTGVISGNVSPADIQTQVSITLNTETISTYTDENGNFLLVGLPTGIYDVLIAPDPESGLSETIITDVEVTAGENTILETVVLQ